MNKLGVSLAAAAAVVAATGYAVAGYNRLVGLEQRIVAQHAQTQNVYSAILSNIRSQGLSVEQYAASVQEALRNAIGGRYGDQGARGALLFIQEQNPTIGQDVFLKLQSAIESGYAAFERSQRLKLDMLREYETALRVFPTNLVAASAGLPAIDLKEYGRLALAAEAQDMFGGAAAQPIDPFKKN